MGIASLVLHGGLFAHERPWDQSQALTPLPEQHADQCLPPKARDDHRCPPTTRPYSPSTRRTPRLANPSPPIRPGQPARPGSASDFGEPDADRRAGLSCRGAGRPQVTLAPGQRRSITFAVAWDLPVVRFGRGGQGATWLKRHAAFFGRSGRRAAAIAAHALRRYPAWEAAIHRWQDPLLEGAEAEASGSAKPVWFSRALLNELYYLVDGGTLWGSTLADVVQHEGGGPAAREHFALLECFDYPYYNTLDVHFYGSWPLAMLWPSIERLIMEDYVDSILQEDPAERQILVLQARAARKVRGAAPHDMGSPHEAPFQLLNAFNFLDPNVWRDLNPKFVLMLYRDHLLAPPPLQGPTFLQRAWAGVKAALAFSKQFDLNGDGIPEHHPKGSDQTFDHWGMRGDVSAYCGALWLAALQVGVIMAELVGDFDAAAELQGWLDMATPKFERELWAEAYYRFDASKRESASEVIMADALAAAWYLEAMGLRSVLRSDRIDSALLTAFHFNVRLYGGPRLIGAVNGMHPTGEVDTSNLQSQEVWTGVSYALAAHLMLRGHTQHAFEVAFGVYNVTYEHGLAFRTPEAWDQDLRFRAAMYQRPLCIWAIEHAVNHPLTGKLATGVDEDHASRDEL